MPNAKRESATSRARRIWWSDAAREARNLIRQQGVPAGNYIDDIAARRRGRNVPDQLGRVADTMREAGIPEREIARTILGYVGRIVTHSGPNAA